MKTSELIGPALDWAVAKCERLNYRIKEKDDLSKHIVVLRSVPCPDNKPGCCVAHYKGDYYSPSTDWSQGGPISERERIDARWTGQEWIAGKTVSWVFGPTELIAKMRCFVASRLGDEVDIPEELL